MTNYKGNNLQINVAYDVVNGNVNSSVDLDPFLFDIVPSDNLE